MSNVYWITGLAGAGKTTIGRLLYEYLKKKNDNLVFLDGDVLRKVFGNDLGYTERERRKAAMRNARLCKLLQEQGIHVICCTIGMFDEVRDWNRKNINNYYEVYIKVSMDTLKKRDKKNLYTKASVGDEKELVGVNIPMEEPKNPDLILYNDGEKSPEEQLEILKKSFSLCEEH